MKRFLVAILVSLGLAGPVAAAEWPHLRGPDLDGRTTASGAFEGSSLGLEPAWRIPLGSGYSGIAVSAGRAVTMFSDGQHDYAVALDAASGKEIWRHRIAETYKGHDGSDDGPLSSPVIADGAVYGLGPRGQLFALKLSDGGTIWSRSLVRDFGAREPEFGFTTTPLVEDDVLVIQTGGADGRAITGIDRKNGKRLWSLGDDEVEYQSPATITLAGRRQVVAISGKRISGIAPRSGEVLWEHALGEDDSVGSATPTSAGGDRFLVFVSGDAAVFELARSADGYEVKELYRTKALGSTYALPVLHDGHLYGFRQQFLSCVDAGTGERVWRSRPPGGRGLVLVDGHLVVFGAKGTVVVAQASPEAYVEKAALQALDGSGYTWPSFAGDRIYVRNLKEMAAVSVVAQRGEGRGTAARKAPATEFGRFVRKVEAAANKKPLVQEFLDRQAGLPIIEGAYVHFVYHGEVDDIAIQGNMIESGLPEPLERIEGTDFYYRTYRLDPGGRWEYRFIVNFDERIADPRNPRTVPAGRGDPLSEVVMPGYAIPSHIAEPTRADRGTLESITFASKLLGDEREVRIYLPPGYAEGRRSYPLLIAHGLDWLEKGLMSNTLDNLIGKQVDPLIVAFVAPAQEWWTEGGGSATDEFVRMLAEEFVPHLEAKYRLIGDAGSRALLGHVYFGLTAAYGALKHPDVFGKVAMLSPSLGLGAGDALMELLASEDRPRVQFYLDWNRWESRNVDTGRDLAQEGLELAQALEQNGYRFAGGEVLDSHGWGSWRSRTDRILESFFPAGSSEPSRR